MPGTDPLLLPDKPTFENRTYSFDFKLFPEFALNNETIVSVAAPFSPGDLPLTSVTFSGTQVQFTIGAGGTAGQQYTITPQVTTNLNHVIGQAFQITLF
jgi:hypothetical protein